MPDQDFEIKVRTTADTAGVKQIESELAKVSESAGKGFPTPGQIGPVPKELAGDEIKEALSGAADQGERLVGEFKEVAGATALSGINLTKMRQEIVTLVREVASGAPISRTLGSLLGALGGPITGAVVGGVALGEALLKSEKYVEEMRDTIHGLTRDLGAHDFLGADELNKHLDQTTSKLNELRDRNVKETKSNLGTIEQLFRRLWTQLGGGGSFTEQQNEELQNTARLRKTQLEDIDKLGAKERDLNKLQHERVVAGEYKAKLDQIEIQHKERLGKIAEETATAGIQYPPGQHPLERAENVRYENAKRIAGYEEDTRKIKLSGAAELAGIESQAASRKISTEDAALGKLESELHTAQALLKYWSQIEDAENPDLLQKRLDVIKSETALTRERAAQFSLATGGVFEPVSAAERLGTFIRGGGAAGAVAAEREREARQQYEAGQIRNFEAWRHELESRRARGVKLSTTETAAAGLSTKQGDMAEVINWLQKLYQLWQ
jgi:hypothetical protein